MSENQENQQAQQENQYQSSYPYYYYPTASPAYYPVYNTRQQTPQQMQQFQQQTGSGTDQGMLPIQESYIENILRLNRGKQATVYMTFEGNSQWNAKVFRGLIEAAGRDHIILSDPQTGKRFLLLMVYLDYVTFDEEINYSYPYGNNPSMASFPPR
ncbi:spore coat protein GerQ [Oceanobacillus manasiensis]|uniref:spore coat protein GerQ n=1 Tax=Oceanobacillus manasiensis TaxID=586413 RepID=UPI0005AA5B48|nr:spore coat protein GerQ [Oceanobacillus manasiensis]